MTEGSMPPVERPKPGRQEGEQEHPREDAGMAKEGLVHGAEPGEHLQGDAGQLDQADRKDDDKTLINKAREKLKGS